MCSLLGGNFRPVTCIKIGAGRENARTTNDSNCDKHGNSARQRVIAKLRNSPGADWRLGYRHGPGVWSVSCGAYGPGGIFRLLFRWLESGRESRMDEYVPFYVGSVIQLVSVAYDSDYGQCRGGHIEKAYAADGVN